MQTSAKDGLARASHGKDLREMKARDKVNDAAESIKPYVERAMADEKLRDDVMRAFGTAREIYKDLMGESPITLASRVATDDDIRNKLRDAIDDLRQANERIQGKKEHSGRNATILIAGIALGLLFNPVTGPETRRFIKDMLSGGESGGGSGGSSNGRGSS
jgi:gas vesicle protein